MCVCVTFRHLCEAQSVVVGRPQHCVSRPAASQRSTGPWDGPSEGPCWPPGVGPPSCPSAGRWAAAATAARLHPPPGAVKHVSSSFLSFCRLCIFFPLLHLNSCLSVFLSLHVCFVFPPSSFWCQLKQLLGFMLNVSCSGGVRNVQLNLPLGEVITLWQWVDNWNDFHCSNCMNKCFQGDVLRLGLSLFLSESSKSSPLLKKT